MSKQQSGYSFRGLLHHARRMLISSEIKPLRLGATIGVLSLTASVVLSIVTVILKIAHPEWIEARGWTSLMLVIAFFGGLTSFLTGIALEYISALLLQAHGRPTFFVVDRSRDELLAPLIAKHREE